MSTITLPSQFLPKSFTLKQQTSQRVSASPFGGSEQAIDLLNDRWVASAELVQNNYENSAYIESFIASMRGQVNNVALYHFARPQPRGTLRGALTLAADAAQGARSITVAINDAADGPELVTNGTFTTDTSGWTSGNSGVLTAPSGALIITANAVDYPQARQVIPTVVGKAYRLEATQIAGVQLSVVMGTVAGGNQLGSASGTGYVTLTFVATSTNSYLTVQANSVGAVSVTVDNISVKQITTAGGTLKAGDMLGVGGLLTMVQSDCQSTGMNLLTYSEQIDNAAWVKSKVGVALFPVVTANYAVAPDGMTTADRVVFDLNGGTTIGDWSAITHTCTVSIGSQYVYSFWAKTNDGSTVVLQNRFDNPVSATLFTVTPTWTRFSFPAIWTVASVNLILWLRGALGTSSYADVCIWGAQLERGTTAGTYIPTTSTAVQSTITVPIVNALRTAKSAGTTVTWDKPTALFRILSTDGVQYTAGMTSTVSLEFGEVI